MHDVKAVKVITGEEHNLSSETLTSKDIYVVLFTKPGTYDYYCHFHGAPNFGQHGTIIVEK